ncbi:hypothetical protein H0H81_007665 [Sphagnurus paluster]|uniref:Uncharacterized protein n=1 Tax=Sphagnurus paluster TaxID=117069 RepID=A0A9P7GRA4_9AGAR|nr:hypothetical protein H0H81_007665 [Sphagnurus paluster]
MSRFIINAIPFETRITNDARQILARDQARAQKLLAGFHPHGPAAFHSKKSAQDSAAASATRHTIDVTDAGSELGPTVLPITQNLFNAGVIPTTSIGISYSPTSHGIANGDMTFGATDTAK